MISLDSAGVHFRVYLPHAARVEVVGSFTDWGRERVAMARQYPGWWSASVPIAEGEHEFCYLIDGSIHLADYAAHGVKMDADGKWVSLLRVAGVPAGGKPAVSVPRSRVGV